MLTLVTALFWQSVWIRTLLAYEILLLPVLRLQTGYLGKNLEVKLSVPVHYTARNQEFVIKTELKNGSKMPMPAIGVRVCCKNTFTGECTYIEETAMASAGNTAELQFYLTVKHCGMIEVSLENVIVQDYLLLFAVEKKKRNINEEVMVLPNVHQIQTKHISRTMEKQEGNHYSKDKSGEDTSEVFDVREYRAGDTYHRIYWKLSAKIDEFLVKEYSLPKEHKIHLFLDLYIEQNITNKSCIQERMDKFLELLASISWSMQRENWHHSVIWWDEKERLLREVDVTSEKETYRMLEQVCLSGFYKNSYDIEKLYTEQKRQDKNMYNAYGRYGEHRMLLSTDGSLSYDGVKETDFKTEQPDEDWKQWKLEM